MAAARTSRSFTHLLDSAFAVGTLATIATGGALLGLGLRDGEPGRVFRLAGRGILERFGVPSGAAPLTSVALGYVHHLVVATGWGVLLALLMLPLRGPWRVVAAVALTAVQVALSVAVLPPVLRVGYAVTANLPGAVPVGVALALALIGGAWVASGEADDD